MKSRKKGKNYFKTKGGYIFYLRIIVDQGKAQKWKNKL